MSALGRQLLLVPTSDVLARAKRFGTRVTAELCQVQGGSQFVARIVMSHALLPGKRASLGLLFVENTDADSAVVAGESLEEVEVAVRAALPTLAGRIHFAASSVRGELYGGDAELPGRSAVRTA